MTPWDALSGGLVGFATGAYVAYLLRRLLLRREWKEIRDTLREGERRQRQFAREFREARDELLERLESASLSRRPPS